MTDDFANSILADCSDWPILKHEGADFNFLVGAILKDYMLVVYTAKQVFFYHINDSQQELFLEKLCVINPFTSLQHFEAL